MKKVFTLTLIMLCTYQLHAQPWEWSNPKPTGSWLTNLFFFNASTGYLIGDLGTILKTTDGGENWSMTPFYLTDNLVTSIFFTCADTGYLTGENGMIMKTSNGGMINSINHTERKNKLSVFPNPCSGRFFLNANQKVDDLSVQVYSSIGKPVLSGSYRKVHFPVSIDISGSAPGLYILVATSDKYKFAEKIIYSDH